MRTGEGCDGVEAGLDVGVDVVFEADEGVVIIVIVVVEHVLG